MGLMLRRGLRVEHIDGDAIVLDRASSRLHQLTGASVEALQLATDGTEPADVPPSLADPLASLVDAGIVTSTTWSRRKFLAASGTGLAATTIFTVALATPAAAASVDCLPGVTPTTLPITYTTPGTHVFIAGPGVTSVLVHAWGGGGGASMRSNGNAGGGGGGGAYFSKRVTVTPCTSYFVAVGGGGLAGLASGGPGGPGGPSSFGATLALAYGGAGGAAAGGGGAGGLAGTGAGVTSFAGGAGAARSGNTGGGGGGSAGSAGNGGAGSGATGGAAGAGTPGGAAGGNGGANGSPGAVPGGGGGSANKDGTPAAGARGEVRLLA